MMMIRLVVMCFLVLLTCCKDKMQIEKEQSEKTVTVEQIWKISIHMDYVDVVELIGRKAITDERNDGVNQMICCKINPKELDRIVPQGDDGNFKITKLNLYIGFRYGKVLLIRWS